MMSAIAHTDLRHSQTIDQPVKHCRQIGLRDALDRSQVKALLGRYVDNRQNTYFTIVNQADVDDIQEPLSMTALRRKRSRDSTGRLCIH